MEIKLPRIKILWKQLRQQRKREYRQRIRQWHSKFAWLPLEIRTDEKNVGYKTVVWFETVMQQGIGNGSKKRTVIWERYPKKVFFKKKLAGEISEDDINMGFDTFATSSSASTHMKTNYIKSGAGIKSSYKRDIIIHRSDDKIIGVSVSQKNE